MNQVVVRNAASKQKYEYIMGRLSETIQLFETNCMTAQLRSMKIKHFYDNIYESRELFHMYMNQEGLIKFMKKYVEQGQIILTDVSVKDNHINICKSAILRTSEYAQEYLKKHDLAIRDVQSKILQKTCEDVSKMVVSFL